METKKGEGLMARVAGVALLLAVSSILLLHGGPGFIGGERVTGTSDVTAIAAFYSHPRMLPYWWQGGVAVLALLLFVSFFRRHVFTLTAEPWVLALTDFATAATVAATPLYLLAAGFESAMVQLVAAGEAGRPSLLGIFAAWDWTYNSFAYFYEAAYMGAWAIIAWKTGALPRWIAVIAGLTAIGHVFNSQVLLTHLPDALTLIPTATFVVWFVGAGIHLVRRGYAAQPPK